MTELKIIPFKAAHFMNISLGPEATRAREGQQVGIWAKAHEIGAVAYTLVADGNIIGCAGIHTLWPGTGEGWAVVSPLAKNYIRAAIMARKGLIEAFKEHGYNRIHAAIDPEWDTAVQFAEWLGFKSEGLMKKYGPNGRDKVLCAYTGGD